MFSTMLYIISGWAAIKALLALVKKEDPTMAIAVALGCLVGTLFF